jgi:iron complex outermembrane receptor protein
MAKFRNRIELLSGCAIAVAMACPAIAQTTSATPSSGAARPAEALAARDDEIIVTAQRREQRLQDVPITIVAQTGAQLERANVTNIRDLGNIAPGLIVASAGNTVAPTIRGVFSGQTDPGNDGNIGIYVDGVYQAMQIANTFDLPNVARVEVLKGPQGTLFGRNAAGGAIRVFTITPDLNESSGQLTLGYGSFNELTAKGFVSAPIVPGMLAASVSASYDEADGQNYDVVRKADSGGKRNFMLRGKLLFAPTASLRLEAFASHTYVRNNDYLAFAAFNGLTIARYFNPSTVITTAKNTYSWSGIPESRIERFEAGGRASLDVGIGTLSNLAAWGQNKIFYLNDGDGTSEPVSYIPAYIRHNDFQDELLFTLNKTGGFQATFGAFVYTATGRFDPLVLSGPLYGGAACFVPNPAASCQAATINIYGVQRTDSWAGFGQADYDLNSRITISAGLRYSYERRRASSGFFGAAFNQPNGPTDAQIPVLGDISFDAWTPRASIRYAFTEEGDNAYFTYSQGFKSGGFGIAAAQVAPWQPERITSYEAGIKTNASRQVSGNLAVFYYDYTNQQVSVNNGFTNTTTNAASSRLWGIEVEGTAHLTDSFTLSANAAYLDAKYESFKNATVILPGNAQCALCGGHNEIVDLSGKPLPKAPEFAMGVTANYNQTFDFGQIRGTATLNYSSPFNWDLAGVVRNPSYVDLGLSASYTPQGTNLTFGVWGKHINDPGYYSNFINSTNFIGVQYIRPEYGVTVKYTFGN